VSGEAWVSGSAQVYGSARVSGSAQVHGSARVSLSPFYLSGARWNVTITPQNIAIGCRCHSHEEWERFTDEEISKMDSCALEFWNEWRGLILSLAIKQRSLAPKEK